jgi:small subunit ribosomal protein S6
LGIAPFKESIGILVIPSLCRRNQNKGLNMAYYEHILITRPDISPAQVDTLVETITNQITEAGGKVTKTEYWGLRNLAYRVKKNRKAHYSLLNVDASSAAMQEVERQLRINEEVLRFMTIRLEALDNEPSVILARREKEEKKAKARADFARADGYDDLEFEIAESMEAE